jgi:AcrR family transcriptional regulator
MSEMSTLSQRGPGRPPSEEIRLRREEEILDAAAELFAEEGYAHANTQALADRLGVGKGTLYRYFPTKRDLFLAAVDRLMRQLKAAVDESIEGVDDVAERMVTGIRTYLTFFAEHPEFVELLVQERANFKDRKKPTYFLYQEANVERWRQVFRELIAEGRVRDIPVDRITNVIGDLMYGTMFTNYYAGREQSPEEQARAILDVAFYGVLSDAERSRRPAHEGGAER